MKKILSLVLIIGVFVFLVGCGREESKNEVRQEDVLVQETNDIEEVIVVEDEEKQVEEVIEKTEEDMVKEAFLDFFTTDEAKSIHTRFLYGTYTGLSKPTYNINNDTLKSFEILEEGFRVSTDIKYVYLTLKRTYEGKCFEGVMLNDIRYYYTINEDSSFTFKYLYPNPGSEPEYGEFTKFNLPLNIKEDLYEVIVKEYSSDVEILSYDYEIIEDYTNHVDIYVTVNYRKDGVEKVGHHNGGYSLLQKNDRREFYWLPTIGANLDANN